MLVDFGRSWPVGIGHMRSFKPTGMLIGSPTILYLLGIVMIHGNPCHLNSTVKSSAHQIKLVACFGSISHSKRAFFRVYQGRLRRWVLLGDAHGKFKGPRLGHALCEIRAISELLDVYPTSKWFISNMLYIIRHI